MKNKILQTILDEKFFFIFRDVDNLRLTAITERLLQHNKHVVEVTYNSHYPPVEQLNILRSKFGHDIILGCGTILELRELKHVTEHCDIDFIVTPHYDEAMIRFARQIGLVSITGALTPTEIMASHRAGSDIIKLFPASLDYIKQIRGPFRNLTIAAVGGITADNAREYIRHGANILGIGSYITDSSLTIGEIDDRIERFMRLSDNS